MKKLASVLAVGLALSSAAAMASDGSVEINGVLTDNTCTVNNGSTAPIVVNLPTLSINTLNAAGKTAGDTGFQISLTNCSAAVTSVKTYFENSMNVSNDRLNNIEPALTRAGNVQVQLLNAQNQPMTLSGTSGNQNDVSTPLVGTGATLQYYARYYATGITTVGNVKAGTTFSMIYN